MRAIIKQYKWPIILSSLLIIFIWAGFDVEQYKIDSCVSEVQTYVTARFSETIIGMDIDGGIYTDTDYWVESASEVYKEVVINDIPIYPPMPKYDKTLKNEDHFYKFHFHTDTKLTIQVSNNTGFTEFQESISKALSCLDSVGQYVDVKLWWKTAYGTDFLI